MFSNCILKFTFRSSHSFSPWIAKERPLCSFKVWWTNQRKGWEKKVTISMKFYIIYISIWWRGIKRIDWICWYGSTCSSSNGPAAAVDRPKQKEMWSLGYATWTDAQFKAHVRVNRDTFDFILDEIRPDIEKTPTNLKPNPIEAHRQLGLSLYRLPMVLIFKSSRIC